MCSLKIRSESKFKDPKLIIPTTNYLLSLKVEHDVSATLCNFFLYMSPLICTNDKKVEITNGTRIKKGKKKKSVVDYEP